MAATMPLEASRTGAATQRIDGSLSSGRRHSPAPHSRACVRGTPPSPAARRARATTPGRPRGAAPSIAARPHPAAAPCPRPWPPAACGGRRASASPGPSCRESFPGTALRRCRAPPDGWCRRSARLGRPGTDAPTWPAERPRAPGSPVRSAWAPAHSPRRAAPADSVPAPGSWPAGAWCCAPRRCGRTAPSGRARRRPRPAPRPIRASASACRRARRRRGPGA